ncbi:MAG: hypothetical protein AAFY20_13060 [Cyanobacteria bacterium J06639_14]
MDLEALMGGTVGLVASAYGFGSFDGGTVGLVASTHATGDLGGGGMSLTVRRDALGMGLLSRILMWVMLFLCIWCRFQPEPS